MGPTASDADPRRAELATNLAALRERVTVACQAAGRDPAGVHLIVVTKTYPAADVLRLASLGVTDIGENRDQEAAPKAEEVHAAGGRVRWHFVGRLQRNKCRSVARYATLVHSVDSVRLVEALNRAALRTPARDSATIADNPAPVAIEEHILRGSAAPIGAAEPRDHGWIRPLDVLVQVSLDGDASRGGAVVDSAEPDVDLDHVLAATAGAGGLRLGGLMAVAPLDWEAERAFATLAGVFERVRAQYPEATILSAGMSGDLEEAIRHGATHVRVGSAVLGARLPPTASHRTLR